MPSERLLQSNVPFTVTVTPDWAQARLDSFVASHLPDYSRSYCQKLIKQGRVLYNGTPLTKPGFVVEPLAQVTISLPPARDPLALKKIIDDLGARIVDQADDFFVVYKPAGLAMHAAYKHDESITLVDWLLSQFASLQEVGDLERPGIVHQLDKYTSGLVIVPRTNRAHMLFGDLFRNRQISKIYYALVEGHPTQTGVIDLPIAVHPSHTKMMAQRGIRGREAVTHYRVIEQFNNAALLEVKPLTGRTHQIRVHCAAIGHPLLGDLVYGHPSALISRQALHAGKLSFDYQGKHYDFEAPLPNDMQEALVALRSIG